MPYGINNETKEITKWMENCVDKVMKSGKDKSAAIAICKTALEKSKSSDLATFIIGSLYKERDESN